MWMETNPCQPRAVPAVCRLLCRNVLGLHGNLSDLTVAASQNDILLCSETVVLDMRHKSVLLVPRFGLPVMLCRGMAAYVRDEYEAFRQPKFECPCCEMLFLEVYGVRKNLYVFCFYRNPTKMTGFFTVY